MKAPLFDFVTAENLHQVFELLEQYGDDARLLAGGQTLLATLNMRLSEPSVVIDISSLAPLKGIRLEDGWLRIGALVTHTGIEESPLVARHAPLLRLAAPHIAHRAIRNRGTWGGSLAFADPAAEWPACVLALDAQIVIAARSGVRRVPASEFFRSLYSTALGPGEVLVSADVPVRREDSVCAFEELARRHGDYAIVGLAGCARWDGARLADVRLAYLGVGTTPLRVPRTEALFEGRFPDAAVLAAADRELRLELAGHLEPIADLTNSAAMKRQLAAVLLRRVVEQLAALPGETP